MVRGTYTIYVERIAMMTDVEQLQWLDVDRSSAAMATPFGD